MKGWLLQRIVLCIKHGNRHDFRPGEIITIFPYRGFLKSAIKMDDLGVPPWLRKFPCCPMSHILFQDSPMFFPICSICFYILPWFSHGFCHVICIFPMVFLGFPMVFPRFSYGFSHWKWPGLQHPADLVHGERAGASCWRRCLEAEMKLGVPDVVVFIPHIFIIYHYLYHLDCGMDLNQKRLDFTSKWRI